MLSSLLMLLLLPYPPSPGEVRELTAMEERAVLDEIASVYRLSAGSVDGNPSAAFSLPTRLWGRNITDFTWSLDGTDGWSITVRKEDLSILSAYVSVYPMPEPPPGTEPLSEQALERIARRVANHHQVGGLEVVPRLEFVDLKARRASFFLTKELHGVRVGVLDLVQVLDPWSGLPVQWDDYPTVWPRISARADLQRMSDRERAWRDAAEAYLSSNPHPFAVAERQVTTRWAVPISSDRASRPKSWVTAHQSFAAHEAEAKAKEMALFYILTVAGLMVGRYEYQEVWVDAMTGDVSAIWTVPLYGQDSEEQSQYRQAKLESGDVELLVNGEIVKLRADVVSTDDGPPATPNAMLLGKGKAMYPVRLSGNRAQGAGFVAELQSSDPIPVPRSLPKLGNQQ